MEIVRRCWLVSLSRSGHRLLPSSLPSLAFSTIPEISRISSKNVLFDVNLFVLTPEIIRGHLQARRADKSTTDSVDGIATLQKQRVEQIVAVNQIKQQRKVLSKLIGQHLNKEEDQVTHLRKSVEDLRIQIADRDKVISDLDSAIATYIAQIPNLLDDRSPAAPLSTLISPL
jgi:seryl-tRNA synthetase